MNKITKGLLIGGVIISVVSTAGVIYIIASNRILADKKEQSRLENMVTNLKGQLKDNEETEKVSPAEVKKVEPINKVPQKNEEHIDSGICPIVKGCSITEAHDHILEEEGISDSEIRDSWKEAMAFEARLYSLDDKIYDSIESEYSSVDALLNDMWGALKGRLSPGAMNEVLVSQREWIKLKDTADIHTKVSMTKDRCEYLLSTYLKA